MKFKFDDGGRADAGFKAGAVAGDCVTRALSIAMALDYREVYNDLKAANAEFAKGRSRKARSVAKKGPTPRNGVHKEVYKPYIEKSGWVWTPTMRVGSGCTVHLKADELPEGRLIVSVSKHLTAVVDGVVHDTYNPSRGGTRCVYGYWQEGA